MSPGGFFSIQQQSRLTLLFKDPTDVCHHHSTLHFKSALNLDDGYDEIAH